MSSVLDNSVRPAAKAPEPGKSGMRALFVSMFWDVGLPVLAYYVARALGCDEYIALLAGTVLSGLRLLWVAVRDRRLDPFALFLLVVFGVGLGLTFLTGDPKLMLLKDVATSALAALFMLGSCVVGRPLTFYAAQRFAGPAGAAELRARWIEPEMRRHFYRMTLVWGTGLLLDAVARVALICLLPLDTAVGASSALMAVGYGALIFWTVRVAGRTEKFRTSRP
ncbi:MAG TPA: VC0807 family protein [Pseudonocardia sp.]